MLSWSFTVQTIGSPTGDGNAPAARPPFATHPRCAALFDDRKLGPYGLANVIPFTETMPANDGATIERRERLGGLLRYYHRKAA